MWFVYFCFPGSVPALLASALFPFPALLFTCLPGDLVRLVSLLFPFVSLLIGHCVRLVSLLVSLVPALGCVSLAILYIGLPGPTFVSQLWTAVPTSALQSFTLVSQLWAAVSNALYLSSFVSQRWAAVSASALQSLILHLSPSSDCCVRLCLAILYMCPHCGLWRAPISSKQMSVQPQKNKGATRCGHATQNTKKQTASKCLFAAVRTSMLW